jgi:hypothetical protein
MTRAALLLAAAVALSTTACRDEDGPTGPGANAVAILIDSDPAGASIVIDDNDTGARTPDTVLVNPGEHTLQLRLDSAGFTYDYNAFLRIIRTDSVLSLRAPMSLQCPLEGSTACYTMARRHRDAAGLRFATAAFGSLFFWQGSGQGIFWPAGSTNSYVSSGMPIIAGRANGEAVALGVYDQGFLAGRPAPKVITAAAGIALTQTTWIVPPFHPQIRPSTVRGIEIEQHVMAVDAVPGVVVVRLVFRNISDLPEYDVVGPHLPPGPVTYTNTHIGFALDPDIGEASDDWMSYDRELDMVFAYDARLEENIFVGAASDAPGMVGLRVLRRPPNTNVVLNGWTNRSNTSGDFYAGTVSELNGFNLLTGTLSYSPDHPDAEIGHLPPGEGDTRIVVTAGPLTLAPGDSAEVIIAVAIAAPAAGTYTPGVIMDAGDPLSQTRALYRAAAPLRERMRAAEGLIGS